MERDEEGELERWTKARKLVGERGRKMEDEWKVPERGRSRVSYIRNPHSKQQALIRIFTLTTGWQDCRGGGPAIQEVLHKTHC